MLNQTLLLVLMGFPQLHERPTEGPTVLELEEALYSGFGLEYVRDWALEGEWNLFLQGPAEAYYPIGDGPHSVTITLWSGDVLLRRVSSSGSVWSQGGLLSIHGELLRLDDEAGLFGGGYCPNGSLTTYTGSNVIKVTVSGGAGWLERRRVRTAQATSARISPARAT